MATSGEGNGFSGIFDASLTESLRSLTLNSPERIYKHQPLVGQTEQRFILFDTSRPTNDEIRVKIVHKSLSVFNLTNNGFIAASYVWGPPSEEHRILIDEKEFLHVTENCFKMLQRFRDLAKGRLLWVDAISINQTDIEEKSKVVTQMATIYESAVEVFAYIGEEIEGTARAFDLFKHAGGPLEELSGIPRHQHPDTPDGRIAQAAHEVLERAWFYRSWVLQEAIKSDDRCTIVCGSIQHKWDRLYPVCYIYWSRRVSPPCMHVAMSMYGYKDGRAMKRLLPLARYCDATDPRDKVFSLLGIASDAETIPTPDYRKSKEQVYTEIAKWWISTYRNLELLENADGPDPDTGAETDPNIASWVPDWSRRPAREILGVFERNSFRAGGPKAFHATFAKEPTLGISPILQACGILVGIADKIISHCKRYADLIPIIRNHASYGSAEGNEKALSTTLHFGPAREGTPNLASERSVFQAYLLWKATYHDQEWPVDNGYHGRRILDHEYLRCHDRRSANLTYESMFRSRRIGRIGRALAITDNGFLCFVPNNMRQGDVIYVLYGSKMPMALRKIDNHYIVIGQCYVDGIMYGELLPEEILCGEKRGVEQNPLPPELPFKYELPKVAGEEEVIEIW